MIAWPTDYLTRSGPRPLADYLDVLGNLARSDAALHEELGLIAYRMRGTGGAGLAPAGNATRPGALSNAAKETAAP